MDRGKRGSGVGVGVSVAGTKAAVTVDVGVTLDGSSVKKAITVADGPG